MGQLRCRALLGVLPIKLTRDKAHVGDFEEQLSAGFAQGDKAQLVNDQKVLAGELFLEPLQAAFIDSFDQFVNQ